MTGLAKPALIQEIEALSRKLDAAKQQGVVDINTAKLVRRHRELVNTASKIWTGNTGNSPYA